MLTSELKIKKVSFGPKKSYYQRNRERILEARKFYKKLYPEKRARIQKAYDDKNKEKKHIDNIRRYRMKKERMLRMETELSKRKWDGNEAKSR